MFFVEFKRELDELTGVRARGWKKAAAEQLGVTERALYDAEKRGEAGPVLVRALRSAQERSKNWGPLKRQAGRWVVATPEAERPEDVEAQVVVVHMHEPAFAALFKFKYDGEVIRLVDEYEQAETRALIELVKIAELKAVDHMKRLARQPEEGGLLPE